MKILGLLMVLITTVVAQDIENEQLLDLLAKQMKAQQLYTEERTRSEGHSGIKQVCNVQSQNQEMLTELWRHSDTIGSSLSTKINWKNWRT